MGERVGSRNTATRKRRSVAGWLLLALLPGCIADPVQEVDLRLDHAAIIDVRLGSLTFLPIPEGERRVTVLRLDVSLLYLRGVRSAEEVSVACTINDTRNRSPFGMTRSVRFEGNVDRDAPRGTGFEGLFEQDLTPGPDREGRYPVQVDTLAGIEPMDVSADSDPPDPTQERLERLLCFAVDNVRSPPAARVPVSNVISISRAELRAMFAARGAQPPIDRPVR